MRLGKQKSRDTSAMTSTPTVFELKKSNVWMPSDDRTI